MSRERVKDYPLYQKIYEIVCHIPPGQVATYGQIAKIAGGCTARMVGYAMAVTPWDQDIPWQRVINSRGKISPRHHGKGDLLQRQLLESEGVVFDAQEKVDLEKFGWKAYYLPASK
ncbi:MAG: MGMT family protein [SAR324 cluster bacterium]|nr:MGMT family protein [SAR324 cluster bacterium]